MGDGLYTRLIAEARTRYNDGDDAMEAAINLPAVRLNSQALARVLADELDRSYSVDATKTREWNLLTKENRDLRSSLTRVEQERDEARADYMRRHKDATDRWLLLEEAKAVLAPLADAARTLEMDGIEGYPFDDPREVLWAGEGGTISVSDFRRAAELHTRLSRASGSELSGDQLEQRVTESAAKPEE